MIKLLAFSALIFTSTVFSMEPNNKKLFIEKVYSRANGVIAFDIRAISILCHTPVMHTRLKDLFDKKFKKVDLSLINNAGINFTLEIHSNPKPANAQEQVQAVLDNINADESAKDFNDKFTIL